MSRLGRWALAVAICAGMAMPGAAQEHRPMDVPDPNLGLAAQRTRLYLKDGSYQVVLSYQVVGKVVRYKSAERNGAVEDVPVAMVDLPATERWKREHEPGAQAAADRAPVLSPELAKEEADRAAITPEVVPNLRLPEDDSVLAMDTYRGTPELVPLAQEGTDLNKETAHAVLKAAVNPAASAHRITEIRGYGSDIQLHVAEPVFYVRIGEEVAVGGGAGMTVDTHGSSGRATPTGGAETSDYVVERLDVRQDVRVVDSFRIGMLGSGKAQPDVFELKEEPLPGGHWLKLSLKEPLDFGEYALVEVLSNHEVNLNVWDFGVHSDAKENVEAMRPEVKKPAVLGRRP